LINDGWSINRRRFVVDSSSIRRRFDVDSSSI